ncbi:hypothetical protein ATCC90586_002091 [Pythium insidiosum]|nr:hypothetical protein ATCC90586_002091 [Pythium insidiosum]
MPRKSLGAPTAPWWRPPGALDASDSDALAASFSATLRSGGSSQLRVLQAVAALVAAPSAEALAALYALTRRATTQVVTLPSHHSALCLRLLDALAERVLALARPAAAPDAGSRRLVELQHALDLLYLFSRGAAIGYPSHALGKALQALVAGIVSASLSGACEHEGVLKLQLLVLAEVLKANAGVRIYVKEMNKIKELYRALTILLNSTEDAELLVFSMAILARLVLGDSLGAKLFSPKNVEQAIDLVFSVLDGSWADTPSGSDRLPDLLRHTPVLQCVSVDLLCDLAERSEILAALERAPKMNAAVHSMLAQVQLNGSAQQLLVATHYLVCVLSLGHQFRKTVVQQLAAGDVLPRMLQAALHPSKLLGIAVTELLLKILSDDLRPLRALLDTAAASQQLSASVAGLIRVLNDAATAVEQSGSVDELVASEEYLLGVQAAQLLARLCEFPALRALCVESLSLNQSASIIQLEATHVNAVDPQQLMSYQPRLSIHVVMLLSRLLAAPTLDDKNKRTLHQFLQSAEVATVLGAAFFNRQDKHLVVDTLLLFHQFLSEASNKRFLALSLAEGVVGVGHRLNEATEALQTTIASLESSVDAQQRSAEKLHAELQQAVRLQDEARAKHEQELQAAKAQAMEQLRQKDDAIAKTSEQLEAQVRELNAQCESMAQLMNKKISALQHREHLLQDTRAKRAALEDENNELKRKVQVLELRLEEVAQSHSVTAEEARIREREMQTLQEEMTALSGEYTAQREELESAREAVKSLERDVHDGAQTQENTFKELVLVSKAHKALADEKDALAKEMDAMRDELSSLESLNITIQSRLQEKKEYAEQLERKMKRLEDSTAIGQHALEDEREKRRALARDLEELRKAHRKLESDIAMAELRAAESRLELEAKDEHIRKCEDEIRGLSVEVNKHAKLQALIHQLSSGGDPASLAASAFLARDS